MNVVCAVVLDSEERLTAFLAQCFYDAAAARGWDGDTSDPARPRRMTDAPGRSDSAAADGAADGAALYDERATDLPGCQPVKTPR